MARSPSFLDQMRHLARGEPPFPEMAGELVESIPLRTKRLTLGQSPSADVVLADAVLAARHAVLEYAQGGYVLADQHTDHGTFVNGRSIERVALRPGDLIHLGAYLFRYKGSHLLWVRQPVAPRLAAIGLTQTTPEGIQLLDAITLVMRPGEFIGLLGASGAGKTTLLDALSGARPARSGRILLGGEALYENYARLSQALGHVPQDDLVHLELSSRQALTYVGRLRLPELTRGERTRRVEETLDLVDLLQRADVPIGKLSGGQRKRVSVAVELLCRPDILFLDEPTSGLDPGMEARLMCTLQQLARLGKTVVCTTHIMDSLARFDKIAILAPGGKLAFFGPPAAARDYFRVDKFAELYERLEAKPPRALQEAFCRHPLGAEVRAAAHEERLPRPLGQQTARLSPRRGSSLGQWLTLTGRLARQVCAEPRRLVLALLQALLMGGLLCAVFDSLPTLTFLLVIASLWFGCGMAAQEIVKERPIYRRERMVNLRLAPYLLSKFAWLACVGAVQSVVLLALVSLWKGPLDWSIFLPTLTLASWNGITLGLVISACAANADKATALVPLVLLPQIVLAGVLMPRADMNVPTRAVAHLVAALWANHAAEIAHLDGKTINADLLADEANLRPLWNLYPDRALRSLDDRRKFLVDLDGVTMHRRGALPGLHGVLLAFVLVQLAAAGIILRGQDVI